MSSFQNLQREAIISLFIQLDINLYLHGRLEDYKSEGNVKWNLNLIMRFKWFILIDVI